MTQSIQIAQGLGRQSFPPIEELLPHRGTMLLLDAVLAGADESLIAQARVQGDAWYADATGAMQIGRAHV